jgi:hypothetical protein
MKSWLHSGPSLESLVESSEVLERRGSCALVMPVLNEQDMLASHIAALGKQSTYSFTLILVSPSPEILRSARKGRFGMIKVLERRAAGASGAFYAGQKYALAEGFTTIILADVGCLPLSTDLVAELQARSLSESGSLFLPKKDHLSAQIRNPHWYGAASRETFLRCGLTYVPFHFGLEDHELLERFSRLGVRTVTLQSASIKHEISPGKWKRFSHILYTLRNSALIAPFHLGSMGYFFSTIGPLVYCDNLANLMPRLNALSALFGDLASLSLFRNPHFESLSLPSYESSDLETALRMPGSKKAILIESPAGRKAADEVSEMLARRSVPFTKIKLSGGLSYLDYSVALLNASFACDTVLVMGWDGPVLSPLTLLPRNLIQIYGTGKVRLIGRSRPITARFLCTLLSCTALLSVSIAFIGLSALSRIRLGNPFDSYGTRCPD